MDVKEFKRLPVLGILRGIEPDILNPLMEAAVSAGLKTVEIAMNTPGADKLIMAAVKFGAGRLTIGAGTILDMRTLKSALDSGASFIVTPVLVNDVADHCSRNKIPFFPGALTPLEIYNAWRGGATMVKVFPSSLFGPAYFREIKGPFDRMELLACGGVTPENMSDYFSSGAAAVAFGASVFRGDWLAKKDFASIRNAIEKFTTQFVNIG